MEKWGRNFFHKFKDKIDKQRKEVAKYMDCIDDDSVRQYFIERDRMNDILLQEEIYLKQRAKVVWLAEEDSNSKYYHATTTARKKINFVTQLKNEDGAMVSKQGEMCQVVRKLFREGF